MRGTWITTVLLALIAVGCREKAPDDTSDGGNTSGDDDGADDGSSDDGATGTGASGTGEGCDPAEIPDFDGSGCAASDTDYQPRDNADDTWPACVTDDGVYHLVADPPSSIARVETFETIADLLWRNGVPSEADFTAARDAYAVDEGLESRLVRREDLHYPEIPMGDWDPGVDPDKQCTVPSNVAKYPDRCAGPASIAPLINEAFVAGQMGEDDPKIHAAHIEAAILWFYYLSTYKECFTCTLAAKDCDSCWAYYTGGFETRDDGIGLSGVVRGINDDAHQAIWDGLSAVRCWRDLYPEADYPTWDDVPGEGQDLHAQAWEQLDNALHHGFMLIVRDRLETQADVCGTSEADANWAFLRIAGPVLDREARERDAEHADTLAGLWAMDMPGPEDLETGTAALDALFPCPQP